MKVMHFQFDIEKTKPEMVCKFMNYIRTNVVSSDVTVFATPFNVSWNDEIVELEITKDTTEEIKKMTIEILKENDIKYNLLEI